MTLISIEVNKTKKKEKEKRASTGSMRDKE